MNTNKNFKEKTSVHTVVHKWMSILKEKGHPKTILVFDSYYFSAETRKLLIEEGIKVCASVNSWRFAEVVAILSKEIKKAGDIQAAYNERHGELVLGYYNPDPQVTN